MNMAISRGIDATHPLVQGNAPTAEANLFQAIAQKIVEKFPRDQADE